MSLLADALQPYMASGLIALGGPPLDVRLPDILTARRAGYYLDFNAAAQWVEVDFGEPQSVTDYLAADSCRLASAAFQTMASGVGEISGATTPAWGFIKLYYASYYAGNALLRLLGESCSFFYRSHVDRIAELGTLIGKQPPFAVVAGLYHCVIKSSATGFTFTKTKSFSGGAHESFWSVFGLRLSALGTSIAAGPLSEIEGQEVFLKLDWLKRALSKNGSPNFAHLSTLRNDVQYRQEYGVWLPVRMRSRERLALSRLAGQWVRDPMRIDVEQGDLLGSFVAACAFIVAACRVMFERIAERSDRGAQSFAVHGPLKALRHAGLRSN